MSSDAPDLVDFAILPQQRVQSYEKTNDEQKEEINRWKAEIEKLQSPQEVKSECPMEENENNQEEEVLPIKEDKDEEKLDASPSMESTKDSAPENLPTEPTQETK